MRWIFVALIVINLTYFGFSFWQQVAVDRQEPGKPQQAETLSNERHLALLSVQGLKPETHGPSQPLEPEPPQNPLPSSPPEQQEPYVCLQIGPSVSREEAAELKEKIESAGFKSSLTESKQLKSVQYWVILPPYPSKNEGLQALRELQARKIDSFLITSNEAENGISLGLFNREPAALALQKALAESGYSAQIRAKEKYETLFWVHAEGFQPIENLRKVVADRGPPAKDLKISNTACERFAE